MKKNKKKVAIIYHHIPEFRKAIFEKLTRDSKLEYVIIADIETIIPALKLVNLDVLEKWGGKHFRRVKNTWFGSHILWQSTISRPSFIREYDILIYLGSMYHLSTWTSALLSKFMGKQVVFWTHGFIDREDDFKGYIRRIFYKLADSLLLYGHRAKKILADYGFAEDKLFVVYNSLDYERQKSSRDFVSKKKIAELKARFFEKADLPTMIFVGRLTSEKQPTLLVDLANEMKKRGHPLNVLIVGDGPDRKMIDDLVTKNNLDGCVYRYGACYDEEELTPLLVGSDLSIIPGFVGLAAMHYMAYGLPVITSDRIEMQKPEVEAIIQGLTGDFFKHGDVQDLAFVTENWMNKERIEVRKNCIAMIEKVYNPDVQRDIINHLCLGGIAQDQPARELKI